MKRGKAKNRCKVTKDFHTRCPDRQFTKFRVVPLRRLKHWLQHHLLNHKQDNRRVRVIQRAISNAHVQEDNSQIHQIVVDLDKKLNRSKLSLLYKSIIL